MCSAVLLQIWRNLFVASLGRLGLFVADCLSALTASLLTHQ
jgi:hypothetical protein